VTTEKDYSQALGAALSLLSLCSYTLLGFGSLALVNLQNLAT